MLQRLQRLLNICSILCSVLFASCNGAPATKTDPASTTYTPTIPQVQNVGPRLFGPTLYTIDARSHDVWLYFDFSRASVVPVIDPKTEDWDLAFQRYVMKTNGGSTNPQGQGAILPLQTSDFAAILRVPDQATFITDVHPINRPHSYNPAVEKWFNYSYLANVLAPKPLVYIIRTQDGKYAKMRLLSYYCTGNVAGCMTFEYMYQGDGSALLTGPGA